MLTKNIDIDDKLVNGALGRVMGFQYCNEKVDVVYIEFNDGSIGRSLMEQDDISRRNNWVPIKQNEVSFGIQKNTYHPCVKQTQFPLALGWACTVHKVQGISLSEGVINFNLHKQRSISQGQMYVAPSRVRKLEKFYLLGQYCSSAIKVNGNARREYERVRAQNKFTGVSK